MMAMSQARVEAFCLMATPEQLSYVTQYFFKQTKELLPETKGVNRTSIELDNIDAFVLAAAMMKLMEPPVLDDEVHLYSAARTEEAQKLNQPERWHRLMKGLHEIAYGREMPDVCGFEGEPC